ncbi:unnamed protein product [Oikopleura dioica]|uniref:Uncharacterized protein n=1 Tax=Oikopleura dioica TaxID=34765 RepID=E4X9Y0_OIKDI|nr:unnamed protein product [Oikopleura dioica]
MTSSYSQERTLKCKRTAFQSGKNVPAPAESKVEKMGSRKGHGAAEYPQRIEDTINGRTYERFI